MEIKQILQAINYLLIRLHSAGIDPIIQDKVIKACKEVTDHLIRRK